MSNHDAACPECTSLLRDVGPSGDPWEHQIQCPGCSGLYHVSCTEVGSGTTWQRLGKYKEKWKCKRCVVQGSEESKIFSQRINELAEQRKPLGNDDQKPKEGACAECLEELRDKNGRQSRRVQCPDCFGAFHFSCTEISDENVWQQLDESHRNMWRCKRCIGFDGQHFVFMEKIKQLTDVLGIPVKQFWNN